MILSNHGSTSSEVADVAGITFASCQAIFTDVLGMKREQKQRRMDIAQEMLTTFNSDPDLHKNIVTGDES